MPVLNVSNSPTKMTRVDAGTYNTTKIIGYRVIVVGTGSLVLSPASESTDITLVSAEVTNVGFGQVAEGLSSITAGAGMSLIVYHE